MQKRALRGTEHLKINSNSTNGGGHGPLGISSIVVASFMLLKFKLSIFFSEKNFEMHILIQ